MPSLSVDAATVKRRPLWKTLYLWVLVGIIGGVLLGHYLPGTAVKMKPLGDGFIKLIKMVIAPVIFCTIVTGIAGMNSMKNVGRVGLKALIYFEIMTTAALIIGLVVANIVKPGSGMNIDPATLDNAAVANYASKAHHEGGLIEFIMGIIPHTIVDAFARGDILQVLVIAVLFAAGLMAVGERGKFLLEIIKQLSDVLFRIIGYIVKLAPLGAFGAMAFTVGKYGVEALGPLLNLMAVFYVTCLLFVFVVLGAVMRFIGLRIWALLKYLKDELLIVLGTSSSEAALAPLMEKMNKAGCDPSITGLVVPTGYSFNLDGTSIYLTLAALFIAQALNIDLTFSQQILLIAVLLLSSKGAAGVTGSGFVVLAGTLATVGYVPIAGLALILGVDRFMSEARALTNFVGNAVATLVMSHWEKALDRPRAQEILK